MLNLGPTRGVCAVLALAVPWIPALGCGGRSAVEAGDDVGEDLARAGEGGTASENSGGRGVTRSIMPAETPGSLRGGDVALPACELGTPSSTAGSGDCAYFFRDRCYSSAIAACACACSGLSNTNCIIDGFLNPDEPQRVSCRER